MKVSSLVMILTLPMVFYGSLGCSRDSDNGTTGGTTGATSKEVEWSRPIVGGSILPTSIPVGAAAAYEQTGGRMVMTWGKSGTTILSDVFELQLAKVAWAYLKPSGEFPTPKADHTAVYDSVSKRMLIFGGQDGLGPTSEVWELGLPADTDPDTFPGTWRMLSPSEKPPARSGHTAVFDDSNNRMLVFGGFNGTTAYFSDLYELSFASGGDGTWKEIASPDFPSARAGHSAILDPVNSRMIIFGGSDGLNDLNDAYEFSWAGGPESWKKMTPSGLLPAARSGHTAVYDSLNKWMIVFGGFNGANLNDSEALDLSQPGSESWIRLSPVGTEIPPARSEHIAIYDPVGQRMIVYGGDGDTTGDVYQLKVN